MKSDFLASGEAIYLATQEANVDSRVLGIVIGALLFGAVVGCAVSSRVYTQDGSEGHMINCSGSALTWGECYEKAGKICGTAGYDILEKTGDTGGAITANQFGLYGSSTITRTMIIKCRPYM